MGIILILKGATKKYDFCKCFSMGIYNQFNGFTDNDVRSIKLALSDKGMSTDNLHYHIVDNLVL